MLILWDRIAGRPLGAKIMAGILLAGIFSLMASPDILNHGKAAAISLAKSASSPMGGTPAPSSDCAPDRHRALETSP